MTRAGRPGDSQPMPTANDAPDIQSLVIKDIELRHEVGIQRYGTALQPHNGRNALQDLYEELIDASMYVKQRLTERDNVLRMVIALSEYLDSDPNPDPNVITLVDAILEMLHGGAR